MQIVIAMLVGLQSFQVGYTDEANHYVHEAEYYQKKTDGFRLEATYYLKKAESYQREATYYTKKGKPQTWHS